MESGQLLSRSRRSQTASTASGGVRSAGSVSARAAVCTSTNWKRFYAR